MRRDFLGEGDPAAGERPKGVLGGRCGRVEGARSKSGAAREQAVIRKVLEGFSQPGRRVHDDLLQRVSTTPELPYLKNPGLPDLFSRRAAWR